MKSLSHNNNQCDIISKSLIIPVYKNEDNIPDLLQALEKLHRSYDGSLEVVFVVDGSPDNCYKIISETIQTCSFKAQVILLSRNFGSFTAIRTGMEHANGKIVAVMAADLQEPIELIEQLFDLLKKDAADVVFGQRTQRNDPLAQKVMSKIYWHLYRKLILPSIPRGGVDVFACNQKVVQAVLSIEEPNSSLIAQLFWVGFRRCFVPYQRQQRLIGKSAWSFKKRFKYFLDSIFSYSDFPIMLILWSGIFSLLITTLLGVFTLIGRMMEWINVPGYTTLILTILFFGSGIITTQGIIGCYLWRTLENTKKRPISIIQDIVSNNSEK